MAGALSIQEARRRRAEILQRSRRGGYCCGSSALVLAQAADLGATGDGFLTTSAQLTLEIADSSNRGSMVSLPECHKRYK
jgi:hypothetical protein